RCVRPCGKSAQAGRSRRRRLYERRDRCRSGVRPAQRRGAQGRGDHVRAGRPLGSEPGQPSVEGVPMQFQVKGRNLEVSDAIRSYAEQKLAKLDRQLQDPRVELELAVERNPSIAANHVAEATIWTNGPVLRAREASSDMRASIDQLVEKLERQVTRYRKQGRSRRRKAARANGPLDDATPVVADEAEPLIVKTKQFTVNPMTPEDAVLQLELIGHDFFVFRSADSGDVTVVYRRRDGNYGLIEPQ